MSLEPPIDEFLAEAEEIIESMNKDLLSVHGSVSGGTKVDPTLINNIFRGAHSLKGISGLFGFTDLTQLAHTLENMLDSIRLGKINHNEDVLDLLFESVEMLRLIVASKAEDAESPSLKEVDSLTKRLDNAENIKPDDNTSEAP